MTKGLETNETIIAKIEESANQPVFLYQIRVPQGNGTYIYHRLAGMQTQDIIFPTVDGYVWQAAAVTHDPISSAQDGSIDATTIKMAGVSSELVSYLTHGSNTINGYEIEILKVFRDELGDPDNYILEFAGEIDGGSYNGNVISVHVRRHLGTFSRIIPGETYGAMCPLRFRITGAGECNYTDPDMSCLHTFADCKRRTDENHIVVGNQENFGGFPWIPKLKQK